MFQCMLGYIQSDSTTLPFGLNKIVSRSLIRSVSCRRLTTVLSVLTDYFVVLSKIIFIRLVFYSSFLYRLSIRILHCVSVSNDGMRGVCSHHATDQVVNQIKLYFSLYLDKRAQ